MATMKDMRKISNEDLINNLCCLMCSYKYLKGHVKEAEKICKVLEERGVVDAEKLFKNWVERYDS